MNPTENFRILVHQTMTQRQCTYGEASHLTCQAHPDSATLMSAYGRSRNTVQFLNAKLQAAPVRAAGQKSFTQFVNEKVKTGMHPSAAESIVRMGHPDLARGPQFVKITMPGDIGRAGHGRAQFANDGPGAPLNNEEIMRLFFLPPGTPVADFLTAYEANGGKATPINYSKIFDSMVQADMKTVAGSYDGSITRCKEKYPQLWTAVDALARMPV